ncbi:hypothetical protein [[Clostridium] polysaccharolyticum]|jgi:hypothetical protein|nr:hypothetical protein [[Clostridium] polysaccharolyticum]
MQNNKDEETYAIYSVCNTKHNLEKAILLVVLLVEVQAVEAGKS